jgi:hypothetical protein
MRSTLLKKKVFKRLTFGSKWAHEEGHEEFPVASKYGNANIPGQGPQTL